MINTLRLLLTALSLTVMLTVSAWAVSLQEAAQRVARQYNGQVVSAQTVDQGGRRVHVIRVLTPDGVVRTVRVPAD